MFIYYIAHLHYYLYFQQNKTYKQDKLGNEIKIQFRLRPSQGKGDGRGRLIWQQSRPLLMSTG